MDRRFANILSFIAVTAFAVAAGLVFMRVGRSTTFQAMLILMASGVLGLLIVTMFGVTRECILFGIGFTIVISPVKDLGFKEGDPNYMWVIQNHTVSAFDAVLLIFIVFYARNIFSTLSKRLSKLVIFLILGYVFAMVLSMTRIGPTGNMKVAITQLVYEFRCFAIFAAVFTLILNPGPRGFMTDLRHILTGFSCAIMLETAIVALEYVGVLRTGPLLLGIRVGSFREGLGMGEALRVGGTFQHPNYLSVFCGSAFLLLWQAETDTLPGAKRSIFYWPGIAGAVLCLLLTLSRSGWAATTAAAMLYVGVMLVGRGYPWLRSLPWKYVAPSLIFMFAVGLYMSSSIINKIFYSGAGNVTSREYMNEMTLIMCAENPLLGVGLGQHGFALSGSSLISQLAVGIGTMPAVHNIYLLITSEIGIFGALCYFLIPFYAVAVGVLTCLRRPNHPATALLCGACTGVVVFQIADLASISLRHLTLPYIYWLLLGLIFGLSTVIREESKQHKEGKTL